MKIRMNGYVPHNHHFLWFAASMQGASAVARGAAAQTAARVNLPELMRQPGFAGLQHYWMTPWFDHVRFGRWDEIAAQPNPAPDLPYVTAIWHYAQGMAAVRPERLEDAQGHLDALAKLAADPLMETLTVWDRYPLAYAVRIAAQTVAAEVALARGDPGTAVRQLQAAVLMEDRIPYDEPEVADMARNLLDGGVLDVDDVLPGDKRSLLKEVRHRPVLPVSQAAMMDQPQESGSLSASEEAEPSSMTNAPRMTD